MDVDKLKQWLEFAQKIQGGGSNFWNTVFEDKYAQEFIKSQTQGFSPFFNQQPPPDQKTDKGWQTETRQDSPLEQPNDYPLVDIYVEETKLVIIFELPGVSKEDIHLSVVANTVIIRGKIHPPFDNREPKHSERFYGPFERKVPLPIPFNEKNISAKFINGLLFVSFQIEKQYEEHIIID